MQNEEIKIIDSHAHLTSKEYEMDADLAIATAKAANVHKIINICTEKEELEQGLLLEKKYPGTIYNVACTTPHDAEKEDDEIFAYFEEKAMNKEIVAVGESGFDDFIEPDNREFQEKLCRRYIDLAIRADLPIVFHVRGDRSFADLFMLAKEFPKFNAIIHCFTGNKEQAKEAAALGWYISISGIATFKRSDELRECIKTVPLDSVLVETDSPWLAPQGYRGKDNQPVYVTEILKTLSSVYGISYEEICQLTNDNAIRAFNLLA